MFQPVEDNDFKSGVAEFEETTPSSPILPSLQSRTQGGTMPPSNPITPVTHITPVTPVASAVIEVVALGAGPANPTLIAPVPIDEDEGSPVLAHIESMAQQAEETVRTMSLDIDMSSVAYLARVGLGNAPESLLDLQLLNIQFQHVFKFATSTTVLGYLYGIALGELDEACNHTSHLHQAMVAVAIKARLFAKCNKRRVKHLKDEMVTTLVRLEDSVHRFIWKMEQHLGWELLGWKEVLELVKFGRAAWEEVVV